MPAVTTIANFLSPEERSNEDGILLDTLQYIEPRKHTRVPNHILDTKIYTKFGRNEYVEAQPSVIHFAGFEVGNQHTIALNIANVSTEVLRMHIIPPQSRFFDIHYTKRDRLVPGLVIECTVDFCPDEWRYYYDCIRINCIGEKNLVIPIHAYPIMSTADFPTQVDFPLVPIGDRESRVFPLKCFVPVDFEYKINITQSHPAFSVYPLSGIVPAVGQADIQVSFAPTEFQTCHMTIEVKTSQFNSQPLIAHFHGSSPPGLLKELTVDMYKTSLPEIRCESPLDRVRSKRAALRHSHDVGSIPQEIEYEGIKFSSNLDSPYAVAQVLNQETGKLRMKDLKNAIEAKHSKDNTATTRQMKEAIFEKAVRTDVYEERQNRLRWQVKIGDNQISGPKRNRILAARENAYHDYQYVKLNKPVAEDEYKRTSPSKKSKRTIRESTQLSSPDIQFDMLSNDTWNRRHSKLHLFTQAAYKIIIRSRVNKRLKKLKPVVKLLKNGSFEQQRTDLDDYLNLTVQSSEDSTHVDQCDIRPYQFPTFKPSRVKDDMAPDALGLVNSQIIDVQVKQKTPYFDLKVPQHYVSQGYQYYDVQEVASGYIHEGLQRQLRTGAEEEKIILPMVATKSVAETLADVSSEEPSGSDATPDLTFHTPLIPPAAMFKPVHKPDLHIFNPCPGLQVFKAPLPYNEVDLDYHLCPLPRYSCKDHADNIHSSTQRKYLDREDVIRGLMTWKKFPSQGLTVLTNTSSLSTVWLPRWTDPFNDELLPTETPALLTELPEDDASNIIEVDEDTADMCLSPEMVNAQFGLDDTLEQIANEMPTVQDFPYNKTLPPNNIPVSANSGFIRREKREAELEYYVTQRYNRLGSKIEATNTQMNKLYTDTSYVLK